MNFGYLDLPDKEYEMVELAGTWSRERHPHTRELNYGIRGVYSMRGCSSHQFNPFIMLKRRNADEFSGEVIGFSLVYSGDFLAQVDVDNSLCDNLYFEDGVTPVKPMPSNYYTIPTKTVAYNGKLLGRTRFIELNKN